MFIYAFNRTVFGNQFKRRFFTHAGHTRNIIGAVPHEGLHINDLSGCISVLFLHDTGSYGKHLGNTFFSQIHRNVVIYQLQSITVTRNNGHGRIVRRHLFGNGPDNIIAFITFRFQHMNA